MKTVRYIVGAISFVMCFVVIAILVGLIVGIMFPRPNSNLIFAGVGMDWRNLPGTILGFLGGLHSFRASIREPKK
jgi:hypothetical protein